jgi:hypothetical protein
MLSISGRGGDTKRESQSELGELQDSLRQRQERYLAADPKHTITDPDYPIS